MWKIFKLGQGPRPDLLAEQWAREAQEEEEREQAEELGKTMDASDAHSKPSLADEEDHWIESQRESASQKRQDFQERMETPKPTRKDFVAMCIAMAEFLIPIALVLIGLFALLIYLLQKFWLHV